MGSSMAGDAAYPGSPVPAGYAGIPDAELLRLHAQGDGEAFAEVVRRHRDRLWAVALRTLGDREEAADALQDALLSAFRSSGRSGYRGDAAVTTWLHRIVLNACFDRLRRARPTAALPEDVAPAPGDPYAAADTGIAVQAALATLPVEQRAAVILVDLQGWSVEAAADILQVAPGTVKSRCSRARARLLPLLADRPEDRADVPAGQQRRKDPDARNQRAALDVPPPSAAEGSSRQ